MNQRLSIEELKELKLWQDKNGEVTPISDLGAKHLLNTIKWLESNANEMKYKEAYFIESGSEDMSTHASEQLSGHAQELYEMSDGQYLDDCTLYPELVEQAKKLGIEW